MGIKYKTVQCKKQVPIKIVCNKCGKSCNLEKELFPEFTTIKNIYGYGSKKDGDRYESHICESCMDDFYATFKIPPTIVNSQVFSVYYFEKD